MEKVHVAAGGPFCVVCRRPKVLGDFIQFFSSLPQFLGVFRNFARPPQKLDFCR